MAENEIAHDFFPFFRKYKDGRIEKPHKLELVPPSTDTKTGVQSKDVVISPDDNVSARLYLPKLADAGQKLPLLVYIHGGGFCIESAFSSVYHNYLNSLASESNVLAVSVDYRLAPEHPIPACYDDVWRVLKWIASHSRSDQEDASEKWIRDYADFCRVFVGGDSAGGNIAHNVVARASVESLGDGFRVVGMVLVNPYFDHVKPERLWLHICPEPTGLEDPRINPGADPGLLKRLVCNRVLICAAEKDFLRDRSWAYHEVLKKSEWSGEVEIFETEGEDHVFHLFRPDSEKAGILMKKVASFLK